MAGTETVVVETATTEVRAGTLRWWREVLYVLAFYGIYTAVRNTQGSAVVSARHAFNNARHIIRWEEWLHVFHEEAIQQAFLGARRFIQFWNVYYGSAHFVVTAVALIWLFRRMPERYPLWRNTLAWTTALALIGFALYPLMPPRLLPSSYGFVDTLDKIGGLWSFDSGAMAKVSNQYAAMPSLHCGWALWVTFVLWPAARKPWARLLVVLYPLITVFCIVVTANHYFLDAVGGAVVFCAGYGMAVLTVRHLSPILTRLGSGRPSSA
ncbi:MAG TPA: phosphatase PAP2 family protein [Acidimicrobiales bacterium]|nr:phosphatase PAP2 family protein [Acidimicrobiales bacterium]